MRYLNVIIFFLLGGIIGFAINFTWSFQQNLITFSTAFLFYFIAGSVAGIKSIKLKSYKTLLLFWYIILLIGYSCSINFSWDLPVLIAICFLSFLSGHYLSRLNSVIKRTLYSGLVMAAFAAWLYFAVPWISYEAKTNIEFKNEAIEYQLTSINTNDSLLSNTSLKGKVVLLDFWYKACGVCFRQYPKMEAVFDHFKDNKDVAIYFVNNGIDSTETIKTFVNNKNIRIPVLVDRNSKLVKKLKLDGFPTFILIDKKGDIAEIHTGYSRDEASVFEEQTIMKIEALLKE